MKKLLIYIIAFFMIAGGFSCKKILQKVDIDGIPAANVWSSAALAQLYLNGLYNVIMPFWPANQSASTFPNPVHNISDDANGGTSLTILNGTVQNTLITDFYASTSSGAYPYIRRINMLFANIDNYGLTPDVTAPIKAQAYFLRAYAYFDLVKIYGGVPYITIPQDWITDTLDVPRNSTSQCIDSMVADLNHCSVLPASWPSAQTGSITRGAALALKARILLYWASPQFNPTNDMSRWQAAYTAAQNAYDTCMIDGYALYANYNRIFLDASSTADHEPILYRSFNGANTTGEYEGYDGVTRPYSQSAGSGGVTNDPTWSLVQAFPMSDGKAITDPTTAIPYDSVYYWHNRDPRFYSTIVYNGAYYGLSSTPDRKQWVYTGISDDKTHPSATGFYCRKNIDTTVTAINSQYGKTYWVELRFAEVMMNLAECANMTGQQAQAYTLLEAIRQRAGIPAGSGGLYGLTAGMTQAEMETAILLERRIEFAFEGKRYDDLRRTRTFDGLNGTTRSQMYIAFKAPYTVKEMETPDPTTGIEPRDTINVDGPDYTKYFTHYVIPITGELPINFLTTYYAYAIPPSDIGKDLNLQQTVGWLYGAENGTFDPTK